MSTGEPGRVVIVGGGVGGVHTARTLRNRGYGGEIIAIDAEPDYPYDRPALSKDFLTGDLDEDDIVTLDADTADRLGVELRLGVAATGLDVLARCLMLADGDQLAYDALVLATGAVARWPAGLRRMRGMTALRTLGDARALRSALSTGSPRVVILGAGFIGCEIASAARAHGLDVTIVEVADRPLGRVVHPAVGNTIGTLHAEHGVHVRFGRTVTRMVGRDRVDAIELSDGETLPADLVVVGIGAAPAAGWISSSTLTVSGGVHTDATLQAGPGPVYVVGDLAQWPGRDGQRMRSEHWTGAVRQAECVAHNLIAPHDPRRWVEVPYIWSDQYEHRLQVAGEATGEITFVVGDPHQASYLALIRREQRIAGAIAFNASELFEPARRAVELSQPWSDVLTHDWANPVTAPAVS